MKSNKASIKTVLDYEGHSSRHWFWQFVFEQVFRVDEQSYVATFLKTVGVNTKLRL